MQDFVQKNRRSESSVVRLGFFKGLDKLSKNFFIGLSYV